MTKLRTLAPALALLALAALAAPVHALTWTCSTVVKKKATDPLSGIFGSRFDQPAINGAGDVTFHAKVKNGGRRLYLYPGAGAPVVVATAGDPAPGGSTFRKFVRPSINDAGEVGFLGDLATGEAVFVREAGGTIVNAAMTGDASPGGGTFAKIVVVSYIAADGDVAFIARVSGGPDGVFLYDKGTDTVSTVALVGDLTGDGRVFCDFLRDCAVGLSDLGHAAFQATTAVDCLAGPVIGGVWQDLLGFTKVADVGDGTPIGGTTYQRFVGAPLANASDKVLFRAKLKPADTCNNPTANVCTMDADCAATCVGGGNAGEACTLLTDCPDQGPGTACVPGICGGDRCLGGPQIGKPCSGAGDCGGNACDVPGQRGQALFLFDPAGPSTVKVAAEGDAAAGTTGFLKTLAQPGGLSNGDQAGFRSKVKQSSASQGVFVYDGVDEPIVLRTQGVPTDQFGFATSYRKIFEDTGLDRSGTQATHSAKVKDTNSPPSNAGLFRCTGA